MQARKRRAVAFVATLVATVLVAATAQALPVWRIRSQPSASTLNVRTGPGVSYGTIGSYPDGTTGVYGTWDASWGNGGGYGWGTWRKVWYAPAGRWGWCFDENTYYDSLLEIGSWEPPVTYWAISPSSPNGANGWYTTNPVITLGRSHGDITNFTVDGSGWNPYGGAITVPNGLHTYGARSHDNRADMWGNIVTFGPFRVDSLAPALSSNAGTLYDNSATITFTSSDNAGGSGLVGVYYSLDGGPTVAATSITVPDAGSHTLAYWAIDLAGNRTDRSATFTVRDTVAPSLSSDAISLYDNSATITLTSSDNAGGSGLAGVYYSLDGGEPVAGTSVTTVALGDHTLAYWATDVAGNRTDGNATFSVRDTIAPALSADAVPVYDNAATIALTASDNADGSGLVGVYYSLNGGEPVEGTSISIDTLGDYTLAYWAIDIAGNRTDGSATFTVRDTIAPALSSDAVASYDNMATVTMTASDNVRGSGLAGIFYSLDDAAPVEASSLTVKVPGDHTLAYWAIDVAGNRTDGSATFAVLDTIAPVLDADAVSTYDNVATISLTAADNADGSGLAGLYYSLDGAAAVEASPVTVKVPGDHTLAYWAIDKSGNRTDGSATFTVRDTIAPTLVSDGVASYDDSATITLTAADNADGSGLAGVYFSLDGGPAAEGTVAQVSVPGQYTLTYWAIDKSGNRIDGSATFTVRDTIAPIAPITSADVRADGSILVHWVGSSDVASYRVLDGSGTVIATVTGASYVFATAREGATYSFQVVAVDAAGNASQPSNSATVTVPWSQNGSPDPGDEPAPGNGSGKKDGDDQGEDESGDVVSRIEVPAGGSFDWKDDETGFEAHFGEITTPGEIIVRRVPENKRGPGGFRIVRGDFFEITCTAEFEGEVLVVLPYDESRVVGKERNLKLFHWKNNGWEDVTVSVDTENNTITGRVSSFSPFMVAYPEVVTSDVSGGAPVVLYAIIGALLGLLGAVVRIVRRRRQATATA